jgi:biopolymer transport protein ExbD
LANWDIFHGDRLEVERGLTTEAVREGRARGEIRDDDLIRPAGTNIPWAPLADFPALLEPEPVPEPPPAAQPVAAEEQGFLEAEFADSDEFDEVADAVYDDEGAESVEFDQFEDVDEDAELDFIAKNAQATRRPELGADDLRLRHDASLLAVPIVPEFVEDEDEYDPLDEDEAAAEFTLSRSGPDKVEELDLAAMVDVAFQLVLFFLVTATTVLYKSLEVPKPNPESPAAATQGRQRTLDDLKNDFILVEIDPAGTMKIDREPVAADMNTLVERLRTAREKTGRKAMLLTADFATAHKHAVLAYDAANEIGLGIAIARPTGGPASDTSPAPAKKAGG